MRKQVITALLGIVVAFAMGMLILSLQGYRAAAGFRSLFAYSLGSRFALAATFEKSAPLILAGLSAAVGFGAGTVNLGQPGQLIAGAITATVVGIVVDLPAVVMVPLLLCSAALAGALWAGIAALMRRWFAMDEFITTLMLNFVADYFVLYLISGPMLDPEMFSPMTRAINPGGVLGFIGGFPVTIAVAVVAVGAVWVTWNGTKGGYELRMTGSNSLFARLGGIRTDRTYLLAMVVSGALAGLAGGLLVMGSRQHRFIKGLGANYAWDGVMIAIIAANGVLSTFLYALFFGVLQTGAMGMELETAVPSEFVLVFQAITVLFVVASRESAHLIVDRMVATRTAYRARGGASDGGPAAYVRRKERKGE